MSLNEKASAAFDVAGIPNLVYAEQRRFEYCLVEAAVCKFPAGIRQIVYNDKSIELRTMAPVYANIKRYLADKPLWRNVFTFRLAFPALTVIVVRGSARPDKAQVRPVYSVYVGTTEGKDDLEFAFKDEYCPLVFPNVYGYGKVCLGAVLCSTVCPFNESVVSCLDALWHSNFTPDAGNLNALYRVLDGAATLATWDLRSTSSLEEGLAYITPVMRACRSGERFSLERVIERTSGTYNRFTEIANRKEVLNGT